MPLTSYRTWHSLLQPCSQLPWLGSSTASSPSPKSHIVFCRHSNFLQRQDAKFEFVYRPTWRERSEAKTGSRAQPMCVNSSRRIALYDSVCPVRPSRPLSDRCWARTGGVCDCEKTVSGVNEIATNRREGLPTNNKHVSQMAFFSFRHSS